MKKIPYILLILTSIVLLTGCAGSEPISKTDFLLDTFVTITIYDNNVDTSILDNSFSLCREYENLFSKTIEKSDVSKINNANGAPVKIDPKTYYLIEKSLEYSELTEGAFDITIGPVTELWDFKSASHKVPSDKAIADALSHVNYQLIELYKDTTTVKLSDPLAKIDLGGIAKGYIADEIKDYLVSEGIGSAVINLGGNVLVIGDKNGSPYTIGIQKPFDKNGAILTDVQVSDRLDHCSVVTSGSYQRYFEKDGLLYHHIIDPKTGYPSSTNLEGVTILADNSLEADILSTSCFILGKEKGKELISSLPNCDAIFY